MCFNKLFCRNIHFHTIFMTTPTIQNIITAEFDLDLGTTITVQYPDDLPIANEILGSYMVPSGAHTRNLDWTYFQIRKNVYIQKSLIPKDNKSIQTLSAENFLELTAELYKFNELLEEFVEPLSVLVSLEKKTLQDNVYFELKVFSKNKVKICHRINLDLIAVMDGDFLKLFLENGRTVGLKFESNNQLWEANSLLQNIYSVLKSEEVFSNYENLFCVNLFKTVRSKLLKRGATTYAMAFVVERKYISLIKPILQVFVSKPGVLALDTTENAKEKHFECVKKCFYQANDFLNTILNEKPNKLERKSKFNELFENCALYANDLLRKKHLLQVKNSKLEGVSISYELEPIISPNAITNSSLLMLLSVFGPKNLIILFKNLVAGKKIIFLSYTNSSADLCRLVSSIPLLINQAPNGLDLIYPYASLYSLSFLGKSSFVAGVTNPIFRSREEWDIFCDLDSGEVLEANFVDSKRIITRVSSNKKRIEENEKETEQSEQRFSARCFFNKGKITTESALDCIFMEFLFSELELCSSASQKEVVLRLYFNEYHRRIFEAIYPQSNSEKRKNDSLRFLENNELSAVQFSELMNYALGHFVSFFDFLNLVDLRKHFLTRSKEVVQTSLFRCYDKIWRGKGYFKQIEGFFKGAEVLQESFVSLNKKSKFQKEKHFYRNLLTESDILEGLVRIESFFDENESTEECLKVVLRTFNVLLHGFEPLAVFLLHKNLFVREKTLNILKTIRNTKLINKNLAEIRKKLWNNLNMIYKLKVL